MMMIDPWSRGQCHQQAQPQPHPLAQFLLLVQRLLLLYSSTLLRMMCQGNRLLGKCATMKQPRHAAIGHMSSGLSATVAGADAAVQSYV